MFKMALFIVSFLIIIDLHQEKAVSRRQLSMQSNGMDDSIIASPKPGGSPRSEYFVLSWNSFHFLFGMDNSTVLTVELY